MNTTLKGTEYEKRVFDYFSKLLEKGSLPVGLQPVTYYNNSFLSVQTLLEQQGVIIDEQNCIDIPFLSNEVLKEKAKELYKSFYFHSSDTAGEVLANKYPEYRINFRDMPKGQLGLLSFFEKTIALSNEIISDQNRMHFRIIGRVERGSFTHTLSQNRA